jgi:hypothetical protein
MLHESGHMVQWDWAGLGFIPLYAGSALYSLMPTQIKSDPGTYVVNRAGHYYAGNRCAAMLAEPAVWPAGDASPADGFDDALWPAVSDPPLVVEFELFTTNQPGVTVIAHTKEKPLGNDGYVYLVNPEGWRAQRPNLVRPGVGPDPQQLGGGHVVGGLPGDPRVRVRVLMGSAGPGCDEAWELPRPPEALVKAG